LRTFANLENPENLENPARVIWRASYPASFKMNPATAPHGPVPKSTPTLADGRLFTLGISGIVTAFEAETGRKIWQRPRDPAEILARRGIARAVRGRSAAASAIPAA
jgi:outer membrane protein assembly factor BamB